MSEDKIKRVKKKYRYERMLSFGIFFMSTALIFVSIFLLVKSKKFNGVENKEKETSQESIQVNTNKTDTYVNEELGYSITYPLLLEPRTITSEDYLSLIIFFVPEGLKGDGFAISVSERSLIEEKNLIKKEIEKETNIKETEEVSIQKGNLRGVKIVLEPEDKESFESKAFAIINSDEYSYTLSSTQNFIDEVLNNFTILN